jgi:CO/xanthine dehydrogenase Mo-binding subunit
MPGEGEPAYRNDAYAKVTGRARYADDLKFHGMAHCVPVYSDFVRAEGLSVDPREAESIDGVTRVITARDVPGSVYFGQIDKDYAMIAESRIMYHGDVVALVVAETRDIALMAAERVKVKATPLPPLTDPAEAMGPDAPVIRPGTTDNIVNHHKVRKGDTQAALDTCDVVVDKTFRTGFVEHAYMEPESAVCVPRTDGIMEVYGSMQHPFTTRRFTAALLGEPLSRVEVYTIPVGGGFGGKDDTAAIVCARTALAARLCNRPVKMTYAREWSMRESYKRHPYILHYRMGLSREGEIKAVQVKMVADSGAYCSVTPWVTWRSTVQCCGPYRVDNVHGDVYGVATNNVFAGAFRGFGSPQVNFAVEQLMDIAAEKVGLSPLEIRRKNILRQDGDTITGQVLNTHKVSIGEVMEKVTAAIDYEKNLTRCSHGRAEGDELYGIGLAISYRGASLGAEGMDFCPATINCQFDGSILLETGIHENGQGSESAMILTLARELGVKKERIIYQRSSTSHIPDGGPTVASRGTLMGCGAVTLAVRKLKGIIADALADGLECAAKEVRFRDDGVWGRTDGKKLSWDEAMARLFLKRVYPFSFAYFRPPDVTWDEETGQGNAYFTYVYSCQAVDLTVNRKTGKVRLLNIVAAHDIGRAVNRPMLLGQIYGGIAQGMGMALMENVQVEDGIVRNLNFDRYKIPKTIHLPEIEAIIVENEDTTSPSGAKGIGEPALEIIAPAIANAIAQATGKRYYGYPITIEKEGTA